MTNDDRHLAANLVTTVALLCAVITTGILLRREFFTANPVEQNNDPVPIENWQEYVEGGHVLGPPDAPIRIIEFGDFQCPACRAFAVEEWPWVVEQLEREVSLVYRHWPLDYHQLAYPAARAAECAGEQGRFREFHDLVYKKQDSLGLKSFEEFARDAGVSDLPRFLACQDQEGLVSSIEDDIQIITELGGRGTPSLIVDGFLLPGRPARRELLRMLRDGVDPSN